VKIKVIRDNWPAALGAALAVLCGLLLWATPLGDSWENASYDYLFRFGNRSATNHVTLILMDNASFDQFHQTRGQPWDRELHTQLLNKLADDGCRMVIFDSFFRIPRDDAKDEALAAAMRRQRAIVLMAEQAQVTHPGFAGAHPTLPYELFLTAARTNWGVAWLDPDLDGIVRRHWPFPSPRTYPSLAETIARVAGTSPDITPRERWLRYYGAEGSWTRMSYRFAFDQPKGYFRDQIVFIGTQPENSIPNGEPDEFSTPYTRWTGESSGGVQIMVTETLNLMNHDWLERPAKKTEATIVLVVGILFGGGLCRLKIIPASLTAVFAMLSVSVAAILLSYATDYWFPWLIIAGGQIPCAFIWTIILKISKANQVTANQSQIVRPPKISGYKLFQPPFGEGAYGKVWLAKNSAGEWRALKVIYREKFGNDSGPYDREFNGISRYQPFSGQHPGLLRVDFVSQKSDDYFYYVMELGDALSAEWQRKPASYRPRDLAGERARAASHRLPVGEVIQLGIALADALDFIHRHGYTHRDIKPQNVIFVNGQPKLADMGLIAEIRPPDAALTFVGTPGYMPPPPEMPGTIQADIYSLGMVLYVLSTGRNAAFFPEIATTLVSEKNPEEFLPLNAVILKACEPDSSRRFATASELRSALEKLLPLPAA